MLVVAGAALVALPEEVVGLRHRGEAASDDEGLDGLLLLPELQIERKRERWLLVLERDRVGRERESNYSVGKKIYLKF